MDVSELRQTINRYLNQLSSDRLRLVADFITFLAQQEHREQNSSVDAESESISAQGSLLSHTETWQGDDFEQCLQTVYETRSMLRIGEDSSQS
ncbi:MAG: hypothetical protein BRC33_03760 [Cyanobacteria bacterium SW_9_44_58]|nr:MAG: hypothetical protein BRC33_03760 [Cyanobacteria bacterium SW_9_44_58]